MLVQFKEKSRTFENMLKLRHFSFINCNLSIKWQKSDQDGGKELKLVAAQWGSDSQCTDSSLKQQDSIRFQWKLAISSAGTVGDETIWAA